MITEQVVKVERRPFHESSVEIVRQALPHELECLAKIIKQTKIPKGHDDLILALNSRFGVGPHLDEVLASVAEQRQEAKAKAAEEAKKKEEITTAT